MGHCRGSKTIPFSIAESRAPRPKNSGHFHSAQVVLKLKDTQERKRTPTYAKMVISCDGLRSKRLCGFCKVRSCHPADLIGEISVRKRLQFHRETFSAVRSVWAFQCRAIPPGGCGSKKSREICTRERCLPRLHSSFCTCPSECRVGFSEMLPHGLCG